MFSPRIHRKFANSHTLFAMLIPPRMAVAFSLVSDVSYHPVPGLLQGPLVQRTASQLLLHSPVKRKKSAGARSGQ
jgi:hypothetical protein